MASAFPSNYAVCNELINNRRRDALFIQLGSRNYIPKTYHGSTLLPREIEGQCLKYKPRTPFDELAKVMDPSLFVDGGFSLHKTRRPTRTAPAWMMDNSKLQLLVRNLRYDKRGVHMGFTMERAIYLAYLYYRVRLNAGEIAGWISNNYSWFGFNADPDVSQETIEGVIKRVTARGNRFFNKLQGCSNQAVTIVGTPEDDFSPEEFAEKFDKWVAANTTELDECQYIQ